MPASVPTSRRTARAGVTVAVTGALLFAGTGTDIASAQPVLPPTLPIPGLATGSLGAQPILATPRLGSVENFRDIGGTAAGYATTDGRHITRGLIYRSNALNPNDLDLATLQMLGLTAVHDLRTTGEAAKNPDRIPAGATYVHTPIVTDEELAAFTAQIDTFQTPEDTRAAIRELYRTFATGDTGRAGFATLLTDLAATDGPQVFHCTAGKDRTGWTTAVLLTLAGVPRDTVIADFLLTNKYSAATFDAGLAEIAAQHGDQVAKVYEPFYRVEANFLEAGFTQIDETYGSFDNYLTQGLGLDQHTIDTLRAKLIQ